MYNICSNSYSFYYLYGLLKYIWKINESYIMKKEIYTNWLPDERYTWRIEMKQCFWQEPFVLQQYRANRDSSLWRSTREVEKLCEYILHLEGAKPMSESYKITCDNCSQDITTTHIYPRYSLRLVEGMRAQTPDAIPDTNSKPELSGIKNFCECSCLKDWLNKE